MKKMLILSMLISFTIICSCQKQDSVAEQQLAQRKLELDAREEAIDKRLNALDEKVNALDEKVNALAEEEQSTMDADTTPAAVQGETPDPEQVQAERDRAIQQFSAEMRALVPNDSKMKAQSDMERHRAMEELQSQRQLQNQRQRKLEMSNGAVFPAPEGNSPTPSSAVEATSPTPSATPQ
jgi:hypothetical protein